MRTIHKDGIKYLQFESFPEDQVIHALFTRQGGVSPSPWDSLNQGGTTGDDRAHVIENRRLAFGSVGLAVESIYDVWQVHGSRILSSGSPRNLDHPHEKADGITTGTPGVTLFMRFADCVPILLYDPHNKVISIVHAGWLGTVNHIAKIAVARMVQDYGSMPKSILAGIGPSIGPDHYSIREDVISQVRGSYPSEWKQLLNEHESIAYFDLWKANQLSLEEAGVQRIETAGICTACHLEDWFSHRAEGARTGRFGVLLALK